MPADVSPDFYREFVVPYNSRLLSERSGVACVHYCGNATHHADNFLATEGLKGLHIFNLYDIRSVTNCRKSSRIVSHCSSATSRINTRSTSTEPPDDPVIRGLVEYIRVFAGRRAARRAASTTP